jgi:hypothetical protein
LAHRELHALEIARVLYALKETIQLADEKLVQIWLPILGLSSHPRVLEEYLALHEITPALRELVVEGKTTIRNALLLAGNKDNLQNRIAELMRSVHLSTSRQREVFELVRDLAAVRDQDPVEILNHPVIVAAAGDHSLSASQKGEEVHRFLRRERNPRFIHAQEGFDAKRKQLDLPESVRISPEPFFETSRLRSEGDVLSLDEYRETLAALDRASATMESLFRISG